MIPALTSHRSLTMLPWKMGRTARLVLYSPNAFKPQLYIGVRIQHCWESASKERQLVSRFFLITATCPNFIDCSPLTKIESCITLASLPDICCRNPVPHITRPTLHLWKIMLCNLWTNRQVLNYVATNGNKPWLQICNLSSWNVCNKQWSRINYHWLMARESCSSMIIPSVMWRWWPGILHGDLAGIHCDFTPTEYELFHSLDNHICTKFFAN